MAGENAVYVSFDILEKFMVDVFQKVGMPEADSKIAAKVLINSD